MRELKPFDYVLTNKGVLMMVKNYEERDRAIIASPKYIPRRYIKDSFRDKVWVMLGDKWS